MKKSKTKNDKQSNNFVRVYNFVRKITSHSPIATLYLDILPQLIIATKELKKIDDKLKNATLNLKTQK